MPAHPWQLRADVRPLEVAAQRWAEVATTTARRGAEVVDAARRATEGWDAAAAERYSDHRRRMLVDLDRFTGVAHQVSASLRAVSAIMTTSQEELDRAWPRVAMVPHAVVGESRHLVFRPERDEDRGTVLRGHEEAEEIRRRLATALDEEGARLRAVRAELAMLRTELAGRAGGGLSRGLGPGEGGSGVGSVQPTVPRAAPAGASGLLSIASAPVSLPDLTGVPASVAAPVAAAVRGLAAPPPGPGDRGAPPPVGGVGAGQRGSRRSGAGRRSRPSRATTPEGPVERPVALAVVHDAPGEERGEPRR